MPIVKRFLASEAPFNKPLKFPQQYDSWFIAAILGAICAGVVVYSLSYSENNNRRQIFFISLLAGLTFPGFLSNALNIDAKVQDQVSGLTEASTEVADESASTEEKVEAAEVSKTKAVEALQEIDAELLDASDKQKVERETQQVIKDIAATAIVKSAEGNVEVSESIKADVARVVAVATTQGFDVERPQFNKLRQQRIDEVEK